jgi:deoxyhypusine monooxygenase
MASSTSADETVASLQQTLTSEQTALAVRFRALFSLKHLASSHPPTSQTLPAIAAIAAAFSTPSALLKHELAYCLGQTGHLEAAPYLRRVLEERSEDPMCRHEAAEALGALADRDSLEVLKRFRDDDKEEDVVKETCQIAVERIEWEFSKKKEEQEKLQKRYAYSSCCVCYYRGHIHCDLDKGGRTLI